jgi:hypothetical protein
MNAKILYRFARLLVLSAMVFSSSVLTQLVTLAESPRAASEITFTAVADAYVTQSIPFLLNQSAKPTKRRFRIGLLKGVLVCISLYYG